MVVGVWKCEELGNVGQQRRDKLSLTVCDLIAEGKEKRRKKREMRKENKRGERTVEA